MWIWESLVECITIDTTIKTDQNNNNVKDQVVLPTKRKERIVLPILRAKVAKMSDKAKEAKEAEDVKGKEAKETKDALKDAKVAKETKDALKRPRTQFFDRVA
jgi:hypothetical protein